MHQSYILDCNTLIYLVMVLKVYNLTIMAPISLSDTLKYSYLP